MNRKEGYYFSKIFQKSYSTISNSISLSFSKKNSNFSQFFSFNYNNYILYIFSFNLFNLFTYFSIATTRFV